jgi:hypothetical protein
MKGDGGAMNGASTQQSTAKAGAAYRKRANDQRSHSCGNQNKQETCASASSRGKKA